MFYRVKSAALSGIDLLPVTVEADVSDGMPSFHIVGFVSVQVREAEDRVRTAMKNSGIVLPPKRITINLSPADLRKEGTRFDLPIAVAVLMALGRLPGERLQNCMILGELGLDGDITGVPGILPSVMLARDLGLSSCLVPAENLAEAQEIQGVETLGFHNLSEVIVYACMGTLPEADQAAKGREALSVVPDFGEISGQETAKRAALIAASGFHNLLMLGPPGCGKSMIARRIPGILPELDEEESLEVTRIYSIAGEMPVNGKLMKIRPYRSPHHTITPIALAGGGKNPRPGEITLAHRGVLFLDELPEMSRQSLEILRQPMEEKKILISRLQGNYTFPAAFLLVAAMNPCPCGCYPDLNRCTCSPTEISRYLNRISQPFLDRMEICVQVEALSYEELTSKRDSVDSARLREQVKKARKIQKERFSGTKVKFNNEIPADLVEEYCPMTREGEGLLKSAYNTMGLSARAYHGICRTSRTIADLEGCEVIGSSHIGEAICLRSADKKLWRVNHG